MPPKAKKAIPQGQQPETDPATIAALPVLLPLEDCQKLLGKYRAMVLKAMAQAQGLQITDDASNKLAINTILEAKALWKEIDDIRKDLGKEARDYTTNINDLARPFLESLKGIENGLREKADTYAASVKEPETTRTDDGSRHNREVYDYEVIDIEKVPREWLVLHDTGVRAAINAGIRVIPGLRIFLNLKGIYRRK